MDESGEQVDQDRIRAEAEAIDPYRYRRHRRVMAAIGIGALAAGLVWVLFVAVDSARNPCQRVRDYTCGREPGSAVCRSYEDLLRDSIDDPSRAIRRGIRDQCLTRINRLKKDDGIAVP